MYSQSDFDAEHRRILDRALNPARDRMLRALTDARAAEPDEFARWQAHLDAKRIVPRERER